MLITYIFTCCCALFCRSQKMENTLIHSPWQRQEEEQKQKANGLAGPCKQQRRDQTPDAQTCPLPLLLHLLWGPEKQGGSGGSHKAPRPGLQALWSRISASPSRINHRLLRESTQRNETCCPGLSNETQPLTPAGLTAPWMPAPSS